MLQLQVAKAHFSIPRISVLFVVALDRRAESPSYSRRRSFPDQLASESNDLSKIKLSEQSQNVNVSVTCNTTLPSSGSASGADQTGVHKSNAAVGVSDVIAG